MEATPTFETRDEADAFCREREQADEQKWFARRQADGRWGVVRTSLRLERPTGTSTESKPRPEQPGDPRTGKPNPFWGAI